MGLTVSDHMMIDEFKKLQKNKAITLNQQILLLEHLGILQTIKQLFPMQTLQIFFLSVLLKGDDSNIKKALAKVSDYRSSLTTKSNYQFLVNTFASLHLKEQEEKTQKILDSIPIKR